MQKASITNNNKAHAKKGETNQQTKKKIKQTQ